MDAMTSTVLNGSRIVPVVVLDDAAFAPDLADALTVGGIPCAEITLRTPAAIDAIRAVSGLSLIHISEPTRPY